MIPNQLGSENYRQTEYFNSLLDSMSTNLQKMKDEVSKVSDQSSKNAMQLNIDMWQSLIDHSNKHMAMMKEMMESKPGMMPGK